MHTSKGISAASFVGYPYVPQEIAGNAIDMQLASNAIVSEFSYEDSNTLS